MSDRFTLWLHILGLAAYFGSTLFLVLAVLPAARALPDAAARQTFLARFFRIYNPLTIGALGVQVMTGAFNLTRYKAVLLGEYYETIGRLLLWKLSLAFLLIMIATYISFGLGHRIVRHEEWNEQLGDKLDGMMRRVPGAAILCLVLSAAITWIALAMTHPSAG